MPARRSELWRRLETVNSALADARRGHTRAQNIAGMWRELADHPDSQASAQRWRKVAAEYIVSIRTLLHLRSELALAIAVKQAPHARTRGDASTRMEKP